MAKVRPAALYLVQLKRQQFTCSRQFGEYIVKPERVDLLYGLGRPFAPLYGAAMTLRSALYRKKIFKKTRLEVPVISVGNLTMGGAGKTPMTFYLAELLRERNPVIVSRGYHGTAAGKVNVVSDGEKMLMDVAEAGDEAYLLGKYLPEVPVVTGPGKGLAAEYAAGQFKPGVIIVDDGFQHLALERDLNMVLFKVDTFLGNNRVFPGGDMREPLKALRRADCFVLTCVDEKNRERARAIGKALQDKFPGIPVFNSAYLPAGVFDQEGRNLTVEEMKGKKYFGFCGLAAPSYFKRVLEDCGLELAGFQEYPDHHLYSDNDLQEITKAAESTGAAGLITTGKDMVKMQSMKPALPVFSISVELIPFEGLNDFILEKISL